MLEDALQGFTGHVKVQVAGPWTLAATVERPRGDKMLADHGARRELAQALAEGVRDHLADVRRRVPDAGPRAAPGRRARPRRGAARGGADGLRFRQAPRRRPARAIRAPGVGVRRSGRVRCRALGALLRAGHAARPAARRRCPRTLGRLRRAHAGRPRRAGRGARGGRRRRPRAGPVARPRHPADDQALTDRVLAWLDALGLDPDAVGQRLLVTPTCGLAGASPAWARRALTLAARSRPTSPETRACELSRLPAHLNGTWPRRGTARGPGHHSSADVVTGPFDPVAGRTSQASGSDGGRLPEADPVHAHGLRQVLLALELLQLVVGAEQAQDRELRHARDAGGDARGLAAVDAEDVRVGDHSTENTW